MAYQGLGRGLGSLIPQRQKGETFNNPRVRAALSLRAKDGEVQEKGVHELSPSAIVMNPYQPRVFFDHRSLEELTASIKQHGILQPLIVTPTESGYRLIAGERRLRAAKMLNLKTVPVVVRKASELESLELALVENLQRQDLNAIEEAESYRQLIQEFGLTQNQVAEKVGKSRSAVTNTLRFLELPSEMQKALADGKITQGHAKILAGMTPKEQTAYFADILEKRLSVRELEEQRKNPEEEKKAKLSDPNIVAQQQQLQTSLGAPVRLRYQKGKGTITIRFFSDEELVRLREKLTLK